MNADPRPPEALQEVLDLADGTINVEQLDFRYIYEIRPIDLRWDAAKALQDLISDWDDLSSLHQDWETAKQLLLEHSRWMGDGEAGATPILVPNPDSWLVLGWVVKQAKSGWTYVISRMPLLWLLHQSESIVQLDPPRSINA